MPAAYDRLKQVLLDEAYREIEVNDMSGPTRMPVVQAVMRSLSLKAAKGNTQAQKLFLASLAVVENEQKRETLKTYDTVRDYQKRMYAEIEACEARGEEPLHILPHPDNISFDLETGEVFFHGPVNEQDRDEWHRLFGVKEAFEDEIAELDATLEGLKGQNIEVLHANKIENEEQLNYAVVMVRDELREFQFLLVTCCLNIMRRWHLSAERVAKHFVLRKLLEKHIREGTEPTSPRPTGTDDYDWERSYYKD